MKFIVVANVDQQREIELKTTNPDAEFVFANSFSDCRSISMYEAIFFLSRNFDAAEIASVERPIFINSVIETLEEKGLPKNVSRINGWPGFLQRSTWEIATNDKGIAGQVFKGLGWNIAFVRDEPGLVAARVISMIINEAFFALEEGVSTIDEIDLAMKLGTNYPYGPFEWLDKIGVENIYSLLKRLSIRDKRYLVSRLLEEKYFKLTSL